MLEENIDLQDVIKNGVVEKYASGRCTVFLLGKDENNSRGVPYVSGLKTLGEMSIPRDDYALKEEAYLVFMDRTDEIVGVTVVRK